MNSTRNQNGKRARCRMCMCATVDSLAACCLHLIVLTDAHQHHHANMKQNSRRSLSPHQTKTRPKYKRNESKRGAAHIFRSGTKPPEISKIFFYIRNTFINILNISVVEIQNDKFKLILVIKNVYFVWTYFLNIKMCTSAIRWVILKDNSFWL